MNDYEDTGCIAYADSEIVEKQRKILSAISHDLKSPVTAMIGFANYLKKDIKNNDPVEAGKWIEILERISLAGGRTLGLITEILTMSRVQAGMETIEPKWNASVAREIDEAVAMFKMEAAARNINLTFWTWTPLPVVRWDMGRMRYRVLNNIISNALKFTPEGGEVVVTAWAEGDRVIIEVSDTGPGIPPSEIERIFHLFEQVEMTNSRVYNSHGLGLSNAKHFVELHDGRIHARNGDPCGAIFSIELPQIVDFCEADE